MAMDVDTTSGLLRLPDRIEPPAEAKIAAPYSLDRQGASNSQPLPAAVPATATIPVIEERRRSPRIECRGTAEISTATNTAPVIGEITNISLHGCYVKTTTVLALDTDVSLAVESLGISIRTQAKVRATYPSTGMGLCFGEMDAEQQAQVGLMLKALWARRTSLS